MADGVNISSHAEARMVADDFFCTSGSAVTEVHFWGSYLTADRHWEQNNPGPPKPLPEPPGVQSFNLRFYQAVPAGLTGFLSRPGQVLQEVQVNYGGVQEQYWDSVPHVGADGRTWWEHKFYYTVELETPFQPEKDATYWLAIGAVPRDEGGWSWGWETSGDHHSDNAVVYHAESHSWADLAEIYGSPVDMAFLLAANNGARYCAGDFNRDGDGDGSDLALFIADFNRTDCYDQGDCEGDADYDGNVDNDDLNTFAAGFGRNDCPCKLPDRP
jgi:hypothetical protein